jgi:hypothetical protein
VAFFLARSRIGNRSGQRQNPEFRSSGTGTLAVRFPAMEHYRSTLSATAIAVFGLVTAAHVLHPGNYEVQTRPARPATVSAVSAGPVAWVDPPARISTPETTGTIQPNARATDGMNAVPALPPAQVAALVPSAALSTPPLPAETPRKVVAVHRGRMAERGQHRSVRLRHAALARTAQADRSAAAPATAQPAPQASTKIDPIGDIIRGLGFGRDG